MRRAVEVTIDAEGRDKGKKFLLTEMPAMQAEKWGTRLVLALAKEGVDVPAEVFGLGMTGVAIMGIHGLAGLSYEAAEPLMDEMFTCVQIIMPAVTRKLVEGDNADIEEVTTRLRLREEVLAMHLNFPRDALRSTLKALLGRAALSTTQTSPPPSELSSQTDSPP